MALEGMDRGWQGPPFDPLALADLLGIEIAANAAIRDAQTVPIGRGRVRIEFNPNRPRGRMRYSVAHELAHTLFPDVAEQVRHRSHHLEVHGDQWQLEALCNIAAAELLMPLATFASTPPEELSMHYVLDQQRKFDVSTEALVIRLVETSVEPLAAFCASATVSASGRQYQLDYTIGSRAWPSRIPPKLRLPRHTVIAQCTAIGYSAKGTESWSDRLGPARVEAVGIPPYPGGDAPRVVGFLTLPPSNDEDDARARIDLVYGNALEPRGEDNKFVVHVVNDKTPNWGGAGFASALRGHWPQVQEDFHDWAAHQRSNLKLGSVRLCRVDERLTVASVVAQHGYGPSEKPRIRYTALREGLRSVAKAAAVRSASIHMPRIGTGQAGGSWDIISDIVEEAFVDEGIPVTVYDLPGTKVRVAPQITFDLF
ncbi:MAG TPA: ImmA/IrrE family metallo-endopeptidase [Gemmatimonadaceae bacterium]|nr:ImmA/IrrE family metallo-endopeptidase [Gemmatimonadaceae bacterium]